MRPIAFASAGLRTGKATQLRSVFLLLSALFITVILQAQTKVSGRITDGSGQPIADATVSVRGGVGATTDSGGHYSLLVSQRGTVQVVASRIGYTSSTRNVSLNGTSVALDFTIEETQANMNAVIVTANTSGRRQQQIPV